MRRRLSLVDRLTIALPLGWLGLFLALPLVAVVALSFQGIADSIPPIRPLIDSAHGHLSIHATTRAFRIIGSDALYTRAFANGLLNAAMTTLGCMLVGFPLSYAIARAPSSRRSLYLFLAILPFWTSFLLRTYAWMGLVRDSGPLNSLLMGLGILDAPLPILYSPAAVLLVMVYSYLPFFVLPMYAVLEKLPQDLLAAAADLGARPLHAFRTVTLPLALPGLVSGAVLVFVPAVGEYVIPELVGNSDTLMIGGILWEEFFQNRDWPVAAAIALVTFLILMLPAVALRRWSGATGTGRA